MTKITESLPRRNTAPIWLQDFYLKTGHDENTRSGTATFVMRKGIPYVCTCRHIMDAVKDPKMVPNSKFPVLALTVETNHLNLGRITANGVELSMRAPRAASKQEEIDIAIAQLPANYWDILNTRKNKLAIDLDAWKEPNWANVRYGLAHGYPDEHKKKKSENDVDYVANQLITVVAEVGSKLARETRTITLNSELRDAHSWYFSGLSGGPLYVAEGMQERKVEEHELFPVGIVFEGFPSSGRDDVAASRDAASAFLSDKDLFVRALTLTPEIFDEWVRECQL